MTYRFLKRETRKEKISFDISNKYAQIREYNISYTFSYLSKRKEDEASTTGLKIII